MMESAHHRPDPDDGEQIAASEFDRLLSSVTTDRATEHGCGAAYEALEDSEERYRYTIALSPLIAWTADALGGLLHVDARGLALTGSTLDALRGERFLALVHAEDRTQMTARWRNNATLGDPVDQELRIRLHDGTYRWHRMRAAPRRDAHGAILRWYGTIEDVHERKLADEAVRWAAGHDQLTGAVSRGAFYDGLHDAVTAAARHDQHVALLLLDLDNFKQINDQFGHDVGDALLKEVAARLARAVEAPMMVGRVGGDEFTLFVARPDQPSLTAAVAKALAVFDQPFHSGEIRYPCRSSVGVAFYPAHGGDAETLRKNADLALYDAKAAGGGGVRYFHNALRLQMQQRLSMLSMARDALQRDRIMPYYQPKIDLRTDAITGFEALLRWNHDSRGVQLPGSIAAAFEDPDLAIRLGARMQERVIADIRRWRRRGLVFGRIAINASAAEFRDGTFGSRLLRSLADAHVPASCIELEITETVILSHNANHVLGIISELSAAGITIALDDFGTGYASLTHLKQFPVDVLKIDRSFIAELNDQCDGAIVRAIVGLGRNLGIKTVAEGIETESQRARLFSRGCAEGQGNLFSLPVPAAKVPQLLKSSGSRSKPRDRRSGQGRRSTDQVGQDKVHWHA